MAFKHCTQFLLFPAIMLVIRFLFILLSPASHVYSACPKFDLDSRICPGLSDLHWALKHFLYCFRVQEPFNLLYTALNPECLHLVLSVHPSFLLISVSHLSSFWHLCAVWQDLAIIPQGVTQIICLSTIWASSPHFRWDQGVDLKWWDLARSFWHGLLCERGYICDSWLSFSDCRKWSSVINLSDQHLVAIDSVWQEVLHKNQEISVSYQLEANRHLCPRCMLTLGHDW